MKKIALFIASLSFFLSSCQSTAEAIAPNATLTVTLVNVISPTFTPTSTPTLSSVWATVTPETEIILLNMELIGTMNRQTPQFAEPTGEHYSSYGIALKTLVQNNLSFTVQGDNGTFVYDWGRLSIIDVSNPQTPVFVGRYDPDSRLVPTDISILSDSLIYMTNGQCEFGIQMCFGYLYLIDVSNPSAPSLIKKIDLEETYAKRIEKIKNYLYTISVSYHAGSWLQIYDISSPTEPVFVGGHGFRSALYDINIVDDYGYFSTKDGLYIVDITNPAIPIDTGFISVGDSAFASYIKDKYAYVAIGDSGIAIVDISNLQMPVLNSTLNIYGRAIKITGKDKLIYVAAGNGGLRVFDISSPTYPREIAHYNSSGYVVDVTSKDNYVYTSDLVEGLMIFQVIEP